MCLREDWFKCLRESIFFGKSYLKRIWYPANHILSEISTVKNCIQICLPQDRFSWKEYVHTISILASRIRKSVFSFARSYVRLFVCQGWDKGTAKVCTSPNAKLGCITQGGVSRIRVALCKVSYHHICPMLPPLWRHRSKIELICSSLLWGGWGKSNFLRRLLYASQKSLF